MIRRKRAPHRVLRNTFNRKCDVSEAGPIYRGFASAMQLGVLEHFEGRPLGSKARQMQVDAPKACIGQPRAGLEIGPGVVALRGYRNTSEDVLIEANEREPVARDQIRMNVLRLGDHLKTLVVVLPLSPAQKQAWRALNTFWYR